jgi:hypothetical protein
LSPIPEDPSKIDEIKENAVDTLNRVFGGRKDINMDIMKKTLKIKYKGVDHVIAIYVTFNNHIELQIVTTYENIVMTESHEDYNHERAGLATDNDKVTITFIDF